MFGKNAVKHKIIVSELIAYFWINSSNIYWLWQYIDSMGWKMSALL